MKSNSSYDSNKSNTSINSIISSLSNLGKSIFTSLCGTNTQYSRGIDHGHKQTIKTNLNHY